MMPGLRVVFMGTPDFAVPALRAVDESVHDIIAVYSQPPRPRGRGHKVKPSPVHEHATENNLPVFHPESLKGKDVQDAFAKLEADVAVVAAYGLILPKPVLQAPKYGCINIHASLLPRWRGASPIQQAIWRGDTESGVTLMQMDEGLDTGGIIAMESVPITPDTTASGLHDRLALLGGDMIVSALDILSKEGVLPAQPQDNSRSTYAPLLKKQDGEIDWNKKAVEIDCQIRALNPWPGVVTEIGGQRLKILSACLGADAKNQPVGIILSKDGEVVCGEGTVLKLQTIQPEGAKPMDFRSAFNGGYIQLGARLGS